jgi:alkylhydroperoxidase family enzyme
MFRRDVTPSSPVVAQTTTTSEPRLQPIPAGEWTEEQRKILGPKAASFGAYNLLGTFLHNWPAYEAFSTLSRHVLGPTSTLTPRLRELAIMRTAWVLDAEYEWAQHKSKALTAGLANEEIERIKQGSEAQGWTATESAMLRAVDDLAINTAITDPVWQDLAGLVTTQQIFDLIYCVGQYVLVAMIAKTCRVQLDDGFSGF